MYSSKPPVRLPSLSRISTRPSTATTVSSRDSIITLTWENILNYFPEPELMVVQIYVGQGLLDEIEGLKRELNEYNNIFEEMNQLLTFHQPSAGFHKSALVSKIKNLSEYLSQEALNSNSSYNTPHYFFNAGISPSSSIHKLSSMDQSSSTTLIDIDPFSQEIDLISPNQETMDFLGTLQKALVEERDLLRRSCEAAQVQLETTHQTSVTNHQDLKILVENLEHQVNVIRKSSKVPSTKENMSNHTSTQSHFSSAPLKPILKNKFSKALNPNHDQEPVVGKDSKPKSSLNQQVERNIFKKLNHSTSINHERENAKREKEFEENSLGDLLEEFIEFEKPLKFNPNTIIHVESRDQTEKNSQFHQPVIMPSHHHHNSSPSPNSSSSLPNSPRRHSSTNSSKKPQLFGLSSLSLPSSPVKKSTEPLIVRKPLGSPRIPGLVSSMVYGKKY